MAATPGTSNRVAVFTANGTVTLLFGGRCRQMISMQVVLSGTVNFTGGTITAALTNDGVTGDPTAGDNLLFTIGTDTNGAFKFVVNKPCMGVIVTAASLVGGTNPVATANIVAY